MIEINLLPGTGKKRSSRAASLDVRALVAGAGARISDRYLVVTIAITAVAVLAGAGLYFSQQRRDSRVTEQQAQASTDSARYAGAIRDQEAAEARRDTLLRQVNIIRSIDNDRYIWPHIMDEVSRALPRFTWLTVMGIVGTPQGTANVVIAPKDSSKPKPKTNSTIRHKPPALPTAIPAEPVQVRIMGETVDIEALPRFMKDLEASPFLGNVQLDKSEMALIQGKDVTQFQLVFDYTRPDSMLVRRVPITLTGGLH